MVLTSSNVLKDEQPRNAISFHVLWTRGGRRSLLRAIAFRTRFREMDQSWHNISLEQLYCHAVGVKDTQVLDQSRGIWAHISNRI